MIRLSQMLIHDSRVDGLQQVGQVCIMIHSGSRGLGHQVATDALTSMERAMSRDKIAVNDRQLACAHIDSQEGQVCTSPMAMTLQDRFLHSDPKVCITALTRFAKLCPLIDDMTLYKLGGFWKTFLLLQDYLAAMACAANYAWVNRSTMTFLVRQAFAKQFKKTPVPFLMYILSSEC